MRPTECVAATAALLKAGQPVWWHGKPGVGKTECGDLVAEMMGAVLVKFPPVVTLESCDVRGIPGEKNGRTVWYPPGFWPRPEPGDERLYLVFLDELNQGTQDVICALSQAVQSYNIGGDFELSRNIRWLAAGNYQEDRAGAKRIVTQMLDRFFHMDFDVSNDDWQNWARDASIDEDVRGYLMFEPASLHDFKPELNERSFPTPRSWVKVASVLPGVPEHLLHPVIAGKVGPGAAAKFLAFRQCRKELPDRAKIYREPERAAIPDKPMILYALALALASDSKTMPNLDALATYGMRLPGEISAFAFLECWRANAKLTGKDQAGKNTYLGDPKMIKSPKMVKWHAMHADILRSFQKGGE